MNEERDAKKVYEPKIKKAKRSREENVRRGLNRVAMKRRIKEKEV